MFPQEVDCVFDASGEYLGGAYTRDRSVRWRQRRRDSMSDIRDRQNAHCYQLKSAISCRQGYHAPARLAWTHYIIGTNTDVNVLPIRLEDVHLLKRRYHVICRQSLAPYDRPQFHLGKQPLDSPRTCDNRFPLVLPLTAPFSPSSYLQTHQPPTQASNG